MGIWSKMVSFLTGDHFSEELYEKWEDVLIEADFGYQNAADILARLRTYAKEGRLKDPEALKLKLLEDVSSLVRFQNLEFTGPKPHVILFLGVNGVGKTTSLAKLAQWHIQRGMKKVVLAAGDTFRSAATDQLQIWGERLGLRVVSQGQGADPGAVIFDAIESAKSRSDELILADSAGRLHNKTNLVKELMKVDKIILNKVGRDSYKKLLVIDTVTGQNAVQQAAVFHEAVGIDALILSKWDSSAKGGAVLSIAKKFNIGVAFVGTGEKAQDFKEFDVHDFAKVVLES